MEKPSRPQRNRRHSRRAWPPEDDLLQLRPTKRLFTPEIKRMLKDWLVRRRENPYPSRDEKKRLAVETGLTYTQICNWFANWRRKLKNSERQRGKRSWGHLIKHYNTNARGNVEQFSISSEDSIWEENELKMCASDEEESIDERYGSSALLRKHSDMSYRPNFYVETEQLSDGQCVTAQTALEAAAGTCCQTQTQAAMENGLCTSKDSKFNKSNIATFTTNKAKYKQKIMEKYMLEECVDATATPMHTATVANAMTVAGGAELSKWLESAAKFTPNRNNYFIEWNGRRKIENRHYIKHVSCGVSNAATACCNVYNSLHHRDELDAAEALTSLALNCRQKIMDTTTSLQSQIKSIGS